MTFREMSSVSTFHGFQFLIGKIMTQCHTCYGLDRLQFQFLIGKIMTVNHAFIIGIVFPFQFLIGKIMTQSIISFRNTFPSFNSS